MRFRPQSRRFSVIKPKEKKQLIPRIIRNYQPLRTHYFTISPFRFMCGRYTFITPAPELAAHFGVVIPEPPSLNYNAAPSQRLPVITDAAPDQLQQFQWGLIPAWSRDPKSGPKPINARAETLAEKPSFRQLAAAPPLPRARRFVLRVAGHAHRESAPPASCGPTKHRLPSRGCGMSGPTAPVAKCAPPSPSSPPRPTT